MLHFLASRELRQQPLLVCVRSLAFDEGSAVGFASRAVANARRLVTLWEAREAPFTALRLNEKLVPAGVQTSWEKFDAGTLVFDSVRSSILRNREFRSFHDDIGAPPIVMIGSGLESTIIASAIDAYWFDIPFTVIGDAVYSNRGLSELECGAALKILTNFVDIVDVAYLEND